MCKWVEGVGLSKLREQLSKGSEAWDLVGGRKPKAGKPECAGGSPWMLRSLDFML